MSDKPTVSHNREDYPIEVRRMLRAAAPVLYGGDLDRAWELFFETAEEDEATFGAQEASAPTSARMQLRAFRLPR